jgi:hypothetical protein
MKKKHIWLVLTAALLVVASTPILIGRQAQASTITEQPLEQLLARIPAKTFEWDYLSFIDYQGVKSQSELVAGIPRMSVLYFADENRFVSSMGFSQIDVHQSMSIGMPPLDQAWVRGTFSPAQLETMFIQQGYMPILPAQDGLPLWGLEGNFNAGLQSNKEKTDSAFLFGGKEGQRWPVAFDDSVIVSSRNEQALRDVAAEKGPMLSEEPRMQALLQALTPKPVKQLLLMQADMVLPRMTEPLGLMAIAQVEELGKTLVLLGLEYTNLSVAQAAEKRLQQSLPDATLQNHRPLSQLLKAYNGQQMTMRIAEGHDGQAWLVIPFEFTNPEEIDPAQYQSPFRMFSRLWLAWDMNWLQE